MTDLLREAKKYAARGFRVFPQDRNKRPCVKKWPEVATSDAAQLDAWWLQFPSANIAIATGGGVLALDVDTKNEQPGLESLAKLESEFGPFNTFRTITPSGGRHVFFSGNGLRNAPALAGFPGIELKGEGGCITLPPSFYSDGRQYRIEVEAELAPFPEALVELCQRSRYDKSDDDQVAGRNVGLTKLAGKLRREGLETRELADRLHEANEALEVPLPSAEVETIAKSIGSKPAGDPILTQHLTDLGNAARMAHLFGDKLRFCDLWRKWLLWTGVRWVIDDTRKIQHFGRKVVKAMYATGLRIKDADLRAIFMQATAGLERAAKLKAMIEMCASETGIPVTPDQLDRDPFKLNVANGTLDLATMELRPAAPTDYITKVAGTSFDPEAKCPLWDAFLDRVTDGNTELVEFLQRSVGWSLSGDTSEQVLFILYGKGANGKTTFLNVVLNLLGDYGGVASAETLLSRKESGGAIRNDIARLKGLRFVSAQEVQQGRRLNESLVKQLSGSDPVTARFLYSEEFTFMPQFKLFVGTNHKPVVKDSSHAMWRRIRLVPFTVTIPEAERDLHFADKLTAELPGILLWACSGFLAWKRDRLGMPAAIKAATAEYESDEDTIAQFIEEIDTGSFDEFSKEIKASDLYRQYTGWCENQGERWPLTQKRLGAALSEKGFNRERRRDGYYYRWQS